MSKIYELPLSYRLARKYVVFTFKTFYSKFIVLGKENIPDKGPVIIAPNHLNALMDALAILSSMPQDLSIVYLARADVFNNKLAAKGLRFVKILPAFRMRDGMENLGKNNDTFDMSEETLIKGNALGIMPEGNQGEQRRLRPIVKGIFRIAFTTQEKLNDSENVKIIPVGLDYSNIIDFGEELIVNYGKPIEVSEYMEQYRQNPAIAINQIRSRFKDELHRVTVDLATETYYDCFETAVEVSNTDAVEKMGLQNNTVSRFHARQSLANHLVELEKNESEKLNQLDKSCEEYRILKKKTKLNTLTLEKPAKFGNLLLQTLLLLITSPVFISGFLLNMFPFLLPGIIRKGLKIKYKGFFSSFDYFLGAIITFPLFYTIQTILFMIFSPFPWWTFPLFIIVMYFLGLGAFKWYKTAKKYADQIRYKFIKDKLTNAMQEIRKNIVNIVDFQA